jgi:hypothetical protein
MCRFIAKSREAPPKNSFHEGRIYRNGSLSWNVEEALSSSSQPGWNEEYSATCRML